MKLPLKLDFNKKYVDFKRYYEEKSPYDMIIMCGAGGVGKTTNCILTALYELQKEKNENKVFYYIRRYKDETNGVKQILDKMLDDVVIKKLPYTGCYEWIFNGRILGYALTLSQQTKFKSKDFVNLASPLCIIYDEYCKEKDKIPYLPEEYNSLMRLCSTVARNNNFKLFLLANNVDPLNQINTTLGIPPYINGDTWDDKERRILYKLMKPSRQLLEEEKETTLYKITQNTIFNAYHYGNETLITKKLPIYDLKNNKDVFLMLRCVFNNCTLNIYIINKKNEIFCQLSNKRILDNKSFLIENFNEINTFEVRRLKNMNFSNVLANKYFNDKLYVDNNNTIFVLNKLIGLIK